MKYSSSDSNLFPQVVASSSSPSVLSFREHQQSKRNSNSLVGEDTRPLAAFAELDKKEKNKKLNFSLIGLCFVDEESIELTYILQEKVLKKIKHMNGRDQSDVSWA